MLLKWYKQPALKLVISVASTFFLLTLILTLHRHYSFYSSYDQGIFNQVFWNSIHGRLFESSLSSQLSTNVVHHNEIPAVYYHRLGQHFTPALLLWLPLYALFPSPATLTVLQVTLVTAAGLVLYILARQYLEPPLSALITVSFYCANAVIGPTLSNFHDVCQIPLFIFGLLLAMEKRWWWLFGVLCVLILSVREDGGVSLFGVGFYMILSRRFPQIGLAVCTLSFTYMIVLTNLIMPQFSQDISERFMIERFGQYAEGKDASTLEILWGMISNPWRLLVELFSPLDRTILYLLGQWLPLAFVPAVAPATWMISGFPLLKLFLGKGVSVLAINIRYAMTVVPGLFYGTILWWSMKQKRQELVETRFTASGSLTEEIPQSKIPRRASDFPQGHLKSKILFLSCRRFWVICLGLSLFFTVTSNPNQTLYFLIPDSIQPWVHISLTRQWHHVLEMRPLLAQIPPDASIAASTYIVPHLSGRREILRFPALQLQNDQQQVVNVDYVIADLWQLRQYHAAFEVDHTILKDMVRVIEQVIGSKEYGIISFKDEVILMHKGIASDSTAVAAWQNYRQEIDPILKQ